MIAGAEIKIEAKKLECLSTPVIKQEGSNAIVTGTLKFSELTVKKPAGCMTAPSLTTKPVTAKIYEEGPTVYERFEPTAGPPERFVIFPLTGCAAEGEYPIKGTVFGRSANATGTEAANQPLTFSETIQKTAGGSLTAGTNPAQLSGKANDELISGSEFGVSES